MKDGFIKIACGVPDLRLADVAYNTESIKAIIETAEKTNVKLLNLPELCITGYTCADLFFNSALIEASLKALKRIADFTRDKNIISTVGLPIEYKNKLYDTVAVLYKGSILGMVPKTYLSNDNGFEECRHFASSTILPKHCFINIFNQEIPFGTDIVFVCQNMKRFAFSVIVGGDLFATASPITRLSSNGANIVLNPNAVPETAGVTNRLLNAVNYESEKNICALALSSPSKGESTQDFVFSGQAIISEAGKNLIKSLPFADKSLYVTEVDVKAIELKRKNKASFEKDAECMAVYFESEISETALSRCFEKNPFIPDDTRLLETKAEEILNIQANALARRIAHTNAKKAVIGISGGLDSTLALLVCSKAMKLLERPQNDILAITMPCFGTTSRTRGNSETLCQLLGVDFKEINIKASVKQHFSDIEQNESTFDVTYENSQARERTQVLMDIANKENGLVIGTGDLSELALGWATYNGDHMSMYGVNASIPKTLIRHIVNYVALNSEEALKKVLLDVLDTPVSPELLPADKFGSIAQKTEDLVGPYELHDFFLYHTVKLCENPAKIFRVAKLCFPEYDGQTIKKWLTVFTRRFFNQQFKRSCSPDSVKADEISLSPRGAFKMPTDAIASVWLKEIEDIKI